MAGRGGANPGERRGGRKAGTPNKKSQEVIDKLDSMGCDPIEGMAKLALGDVPCKLCKESGQVTIAQFYNAFGLRLTKEQVETANDIAAITDELVTCPVCAGTTIEPVNTKLRSDMFKELAQYVAPKRKAIEHSGGIDVSHEKWLDKLDE